MATGVQPSKFINYISQFKKVLVTRNNGVITQTFKIDSSIDDNYYFSIVNSNNQLISLEGRVFRIYGSLIDTKEQMHILFYSDRCTIENGTQMHFKIETYTSQYMSWVKSKRIIDLTIVEVANPDAPEEEQTTQVVLRDEAIAYKRPYIENQTPTEILQKVILTTNVPLTGAFGSGHDIDLTIGSDGAAFGTGLKQTGDNQLVIGQYNEADATKAFVIGNGEDDSNRSNAFTVDYQGNVEAKSITVDGQNVSDKVNQLENDIEAVSAAIPSVEGFATEQWVQEQGYLTAHQDLTAYATKDWVEGKGYITGVNLDPYATKDQLTAYATKSDLTVSASVLSNQISQLALNIPTKVSDLTNDAGYLTNIPTSYALKTDIPTGNAQLQNTAGYITGYNAGTGISISNGTISLTGEVGKTYYADNNTLQLNNSTNTFSIKSLSSKLNQGQNILLTPQSDGSVTINAIGGGGGGTGGATYLAGLGLSLSTVSAEDGIYKFYVNEPWLDNKINTATSGIQNLSAGTGLKIEDNVISLTAEIPSIDGLASEQWVEANFLSAIPSNYATKDYVDSSVSGKADLSSVYTKEEVYTYIETDAKINEATSGKADKSELTGLATKDEVQAVDDKFDNYYTSAQVDQAIAAAVEDIPSTVYTGEDGIKVDNGVISLTATLSSITNDAGFITSADIPTSYVQQSELESVSGQLTNAIGAKANTTQVEAEFTATSAWANETFLTEHQSLSSYYTKSEVDSAIGTATNDMATQTWVEEQGYLTAHQSLDDYYNKTEVDTALALKADSADVYTKTEVNNISTNIVSQIPTDVATSAYVQAASGNAVSVATGWVDDQNYLTEIPSEYITETELATELEPYAQTTDVTTAITNATSGKADQSTVESLSTALSTAIDTKANSADVYTKSQVYTKGETDSAINTSTSGKVNKTDFDTVTGALSTAIDTKVTSAQVKDQVEAYGYITGYTAGTNISISNQNVISLTGTTPIFVNYQGQDCVVDKIVFDEIFDRGYYSHDGTSGVLEVNFIPTVNVSYSELDEPLRAEQLTFSDDFSIEYYEGGDYYDFQISINSDILSGCATKTELQSVSGTLSTAISGVSNRVGAIEADYIKSADMTATSTWINNTFETKTNVNNLTGRVKAIEDDYTTSAYVTGQVNNLATGAVATNTANIGQLSTNLGTVSGKANANETAIDTLSTDLGTANGNISTLSTDLSTVSGKANTNADNISSLSTRIGTANGNITTLSTDLGTVSGDVDTLKNQAVTSSYLTSYVNNQFVAVSQLANDVGYITAGDLPEGTVYLAGEGLKLQNAVFSLTGTVLSGDGSTIAINNNVISVIGGGSGGKTYTGGTGIEVDNTNDTISLTATIPTAISDLTNDSQFATSAQVSAIITGYNYLSSITVSYYDQSESRYVQVSAAGLKFTTDFNVTIDSGNNYAWIGWKGLLNMGGVQGAEEFYADHVQWSSEFDVYQSEGGVYVGLVPLSTSQITNDSGYTTSAVVSAIASAYAQGGGGGFEYTSLTPSLLAVDNTNHTLSAATQSGGGGTTYTAGDGIDITNDEISVKLSGGDNVTLSTDATGLVTINATGGGGSVNKNQKVLTLAGDTVKYNSEYDIFETTGNAVVDGVITIQPVTNMSLGEGEVATFEHWITPSATITGFAFDSSYQFIGELPSSFTDNCIQVFTVRVYNSPFGIKYCISYAYQFADPWFTPLTFKAVNGPTTFGIGVENGGWNNDIHLSCSLDNGETWTEINKVTWTQTVNQNEVIMFSGNNYSLPWNNYSSYIYFKTSGYFQALGNIHSLVKYRRNLINGGFLGIFNNCSGLLKAPSLPATTLANSCYRSMFYGCSNLSTAPTLPATTLAPSCYFNMFNKCTSLTAAPQLPATGLAEACYRFMFYQCTSLTGAPVLPVTTLVKNCYAGMFINCTSLTDAPQLPATTLADSCYNWMFNGCSNLSSINVAFTDWSPSNATTSWAGSIAANGTFTKPNALAEEYGTNRIPSGWTVINK